MGIKEIFLNLTSRTYPHGQEDFLDSCEAFKFILPKKLELDEFGNRFIKIGDSSCMFTSHLDTATSANVSVTHVIQDNIIKTDGKSILGADDKAGVTIMLYMIYHNIPGLYYFFLGEEVGCLGSKKVASKAIDILKSDEYHFLKDIKKVISFDRRGKTSVITYQSSSRCCSNKFAEDLAKQLNDNNASFAYKPDDTGVYTDSASFVKIYPECTNISVGYRSEHTFSESQDINHLIELCSTVIKVDWESLSVERDPSVSDYKSYGGYGYWPGGDDEYDEYGYYFRDNSRYSYKPTWERQRETEKDEVYHFIDPIYGTISSVKIKKLTSKLISIDLDEERLNDERILIANLLDTLEVNYSEVSWDGFKLIVKHNLPQGHTTQCTRDEISEFIVELDFWKESIMEDFNLDNNKLLAF